MYAALWCPELVYEYLTLAFNIAATEFLTGAPPVTANRHILQLDSSVTSEQADEDMQAPQPPALLVFSGGTAFNSVAGFNTQMVQ